MELRLVSTALELQAALGVRQRVFVAEQGVSPALEIDEHDTLGGAATHALATLGGEVVGTGRLRSVEPGLGKLERLAVLSGDRGKGVGRALTQYFEALAVTNGFVRLTLNAQHSAVGFYEKLGYVAVGEPFVEADIAHQRMDKSLL